MATYTSCASLPTGSFLCDIQCHGQQFYTSYKHIEKHEVNTPSPFSGFTELRAFGSVETTGRTVHWCGKSSPEREPLCSGPIPFLIGSNTLKKSFHTCQPSWFMWGKNDGLGDGSFEVTQRDTIRGYLCGAPSEILGRSFPAQKQYSRVDWCHFMKVHSPC